MKNWYIVQSHSNFENKVAGLIKEEAEKAKISDKFEEIIVPPHDVTEVKRGKRVQRKKRDITTAIANTISAPCAVSLPVGQETLKASCFTSWINLIGFLIINYKYNLIGRSGGTRTLSLRFWRPALYQLSYTPI